MHAYLPPDILRVMTSIPPGHAIGLGFTTKCLEFCGLLVCKIEFPKHMLHHRIM